MSTIYTVLWSDGETRDYRSLSQAAADITARYPDAVYGPDAMSEPDASDLRLRSDRILVWSDEDMSTGDDGTDAVAEIRVQ